MTHVITRACCNDAACVPACPVNCIHPTPDEPDYGSAEMLYIDPDGCIDCGACVDVCPVSAISADYDLGEDELRYEEINARWFSRPREAAPSAPRIVETPERWRDRGPLHVAIVGTGPSACYAAEELLGERGLDVRVDLLERLLTPGGLVRFGVAPDHQDTKAAGDAFARTLRRPGVRVHLGVEVGTDVTPADLRERYDAVIYAQGAAGDRPLGIVGEDLPGSISATSLVAWYNGHPDAADLTPDLSHPRAVVVGNGNVALDVARILLSGHEALRRTDIADHALDALRGSAIEEVVVLGRRGPIEAAFTTPELLSLLQADGLSVAVDLPDGVELPDRHDDPIVDLRLELLREAAARTAGGPTIRLRFQAAPVRIEGEERVEGIVLERTRLRETSEGVAAEGTGAEDLLECGLVVRAIGYRGASLPGLPHEPRGGTVPHRAGRVVGEDGAARVGEYVTGWAKRGAAGVIGTNRHCARETVRSLLADHAAGVLGGGERTGIDDLVPHARDLEAWRLIDAHERAQGRAARRPRVKVVSLRDQETIVEAGR